MFFKSALSGIIIATLLLAARDAASCTTFLMAHDNQILVGKNYDFDIGYGLVVVNKRGVSKVALHLTGDEALHEWTSRFASITFNQFGCDQPHGGMNEAGLTVELMWLDETEYASGDDRPTVNELQWIQWALDSFETVDELFEAVPSVRVSPVASYIHYLVCDRTAACAVFEHLDGELVITSGDDIVANTLANHTYDDAAAFLVTHEGFGGTEPIPEGSDSQDRFVRASALALETPSGDPVDAAFDILDDVSQSFTLWQLVYDLSQGAAHFRTSAADTVKSVSLDAFEPSCVEDRRLLDIDIATPGDVSEHFELYTEEANRALVEQSLSAMGSFPESVYQTAAEYPGTTECTLTPDDGADAGADAGGDSGCGCSMTGASSAPGWMELLGLVLTGLITTVR